MTNTNDNDIDALLYLLAAQSHIQFHSALTALVAERDALRKECNNRFDFVKIKELVAEVASLRVEHAAAIKQREEAKADFVDAWRERCEFAKRIYEADAALADVLQAVQKSHDAMVLARTSHGCALACDPPLDAWKYRCVDAHLGDAIRECAAAMRKGEA